MLREKLIDSEVDEDLLTDRVLKQMSELTIQGRCEYIFKKHKKEVTQTKLLQFYKRNSIKLSFQPEERIFTQGPITSLTPINYSPSFKTPNKEYIKELQCEEQISTKPVNKRMLATPEQLHTICEAPHFEDNINEVSQVFTAPTTPVISHQVFRPSELNPEEEA